MLNNTRFFTLILFCFIFVKGFSQSRQLLNLQNGNSVLLEKKQNGTVFFIKVQENAQSPLNELQILSASLGIKATDFVLKSVEQDALGFTHHRYTQSHNGIPVEGAMYISHLKEGSLQSANGSFYNITNTAKDAIAVKSVGSSLVNGLLIKSYEGLAYAPKNGIFTSDNYVLTHKYLCYNNNPLDVSYVYMNASTGEFVWRQLLAIPITAEGTAVTKYSGTRSITTDSIGPNLFHLEDKTRGGGIVTYDNQHNSDFFDYSGAVHFTDTDNNWNNVNPNQDEVATDVHWGVAKSYDYFLDVLGRNSFDGNGSQIRSYVHFDYSYDNAFWFNNQLSFGDGSGGTFKGPLTSIDVCAHELAHGVTQYTAGLIYERESGALNESFSDIFGNTVEFANKTGNWAIGEEITTGNGIRNMANPNAFSHPDTYKGTHWRVADETCIPDGGPGGNDNCGVHYNSGVLNYWYYLLVEGGAGTNDNADAYSVAGIDFERASKIAYRTLSVYLTPNSDYAEARMYSIMSAEDLYGACSNEVIQTTNAWQAVGVGGVFGTGFKVENILVEDSTLCDFESPIRMVPITSEVASFQWDMGDGTLYNDSIATHTYTEKGAFTVTLMVEGCSGELDTLVKPNFIHINPDSTFCDTIIMAKTGSKLYSKCNAVIYDQGGPNGNYLNNSTTDIQFEISEADSFQLSFLAFQYENNYDSLFIYDGTTPIANLIGGYTGYTLPNGGAAITVPGTKLSILHFSDPGLNFPGFKAHLQCFISDPVASFNAISIDECKGEYQFINETSGFIDSIKWLIDGAYIASTDTLNHQFLANAEYDVELIVYKAGMTDSSTQSVLLQKVILASNNTPDSMEVDKAYSLVDLSQGAVSREWWVDGVMSGDEDIFTFTPSEEKTYVITMVAQSIYACSDSIRTEVTAYRKFPIGIEELNSSTLIYPNPFVDKVNLNLKETTTIEIYNVLGVLVYKSTGKEGWHTIDLRELPKGSYTMQLRGKSNTQKIIIKQ